MAATWKAPSTQTTPAAAFSELRAARDPAPVPGETRTQAIADPGQRHFHARIRLMRLQDGVWSDLGNTLPPAVSPGHAEWAGSCLLHDDGSTVTLFFTAAGSAARAGGYEQELWAASALAGTGSLPTGWSQPVPLVRGYAPHYMPADAHEGEAGKIKAFRDPAYFRDPADGSEYLAFTASLAGSPSAFNLPWHRQLI